MISITGHELSLKDVKYVVLDEADEMLDMGFMPSMEFILLEAMNKIHPQLLLFSATMKGKIKNLAERFVHGKPMLEIDVSHDVLTVENCVQQYYVVADQESKWDNFCKIFKQEKPERSIIFVNKKFTAKKLLKKIQNQRNLHLNADVIQGNMTQNKRELTMKAFRDNSINCLVATDIASRGLDFSGITHIFNYDFPPYQENYVHRIGRTSRMDENGKAISLLLKDQKKLLERVETFTNSKIEHQNLPGMVEDFTEKEPENRTKRTRNSRRHNNQFTHSPWKSHERRSSHQSSDNEKSLNTFFFFISKRISKKSNTKIFKTKIRDLLNI